MQTSKLIIFLFLFIFCLLPFAFTGCSDTTTNPGNPNPPAPADSTVKLISPPNDTVFYFDTSYANHPISFIWHKVFNVTHYWFQISTDSMFINGGIEEVADTIHQRIPPSLFNPSYWRVRVYTHGFPPSTYWSETRHFTPIFQP